MRVLFVCSGNTCRSALAEGFARRGAARGAKFESAGLEAVAGEPASAEAMAVAAEQGVSLAAHRARPLEAAALARSEVIYVMTRSQAEALRARAPETGDRVQLLDAEGRDIPDPHGLGLGAYRHTRDAIAAAVEARRPEWLSRGEERAG